MGPYVSGLSIYPIKSCKGISVTSALITPSGLAWDREWVVVRSSDGKFCSQRATPQLALVSVKLPSEALEGSTLGQLPADACMEVSAPGCGSLKVPLSPYLQNMCPRRVQVWEWTGTGMDEGDHAAAWFSSFLGMDCRLVRYIGKSRMPSAASAPAFSEHDISRLTDPEFAAGSETSFADGFPMLLASEEDLADLNAHLGGRITLTMARFRPNIVIKGVPAWKEDCCRTVSVLTIDHDTIDFVSVKPCSRCKVPTIDPDTAEPGDEPLDTLQTFRSGDHLGWSRKSWKHAVFFGTNLIATPQACGRVIHVGNGLELSGQQTPW